MESLRELDRAIFLFFNGTIHREWLNPVFWILTTTGLGYVQVLLSLPLTRWKQMRPLFWRIVCAVLLGLLVHIPKRLLPRDRPTNWDQTITTPDELIFGHSFPSGHATTAFGVATVIAIWAWKADTKWLSLSVFAWAALVGISRIYRGVHWPSDVLAGCLMGIAAGAIVHWIWQKPTTESA